MIPRSTILKLTVCASRQGVQNLCHTKWHSCNIRYSSLNISEYKKKKKKKKSILTKILYVLYYRRHLELNGWGKTPFNDDYPHGTNNVAHQIWVWSRGMGAFLRWTKRLKWWSGGGQEGDAEEFTCQFTNVLENSVLYRFSHVAVFKEMT